jgi:hypothetical protein
VCAKEVVLVANALGRKELRMYKQGERLNRKEAIFAQSYDCMGYYAGGTGDCQSQSCPLYQYMPYRK